MADRTLELTWDPEIDTPATIAILGAGPIGIEAALYARFLGYFVMVFDQGKAANEFLKWGNLPLEGTFEELSSTVGRAAILAQAESEAMPRLDERLTSREFVDRYVVPLAKTDLIYENVFVHSRVASVSRMVWKAFHSGDDQDRADDEFRLLVHSKNRGWYSTRADIVLDTSGCCGYGALGPGGGLAQGEIEEADAFFRGVVDWGSSHNAKYAGKHTVLFGCNAKAIANAIQFANALSENPATRLTWIVPLDPGITTAIEQIQRSSAACPVVRQISDAPALKLALAGDLVGLGVLPAFGLEKVLRSAKGFSISVQVNEDSLIEIDCDEIIANAQSTPIWEHATSLRIGRDPSLARPLISDIAKDATDGSLVLKDPTMSILTKEPHYYVLGSKSFGMDSARFELSFGHQQIREAFALIGGRSNLDLYQQFATRSGME